MVGHMQHGTHWTIDEVPWNRFDRSQVTDELLAVIKAASLVERNAGDYVTYLSHVFTDDDEFRAAAEQWGREEVQHGEALGRWAMLADPTFDFEASFKAFQSRYRLPLDASESVRGSRSGELIARCVVESGTSSFYSALRDGTTEPVLKFLCHRIAGDEFRHYRLFYDHLQRYLAKERPWRIKRAIVAAQRFAEIEDDELALAYHCANHPDQVYNRRRAAESYMQKAYAFYRRSHLDRAVGMMAKAAGLDPKGTIAELASRLAWGYTQRQIRLLPAA